MLSAVRKIQNFKKHIHIFKLKFQNDKVFATHSSVECSRTVTQMILMEKNNLNSIQVQCRWQYTLVHRLKTGDFTAKSIRNL